MKRKMKNEMPVLAIGFVFLEGQKYRNGFIIGFHGAKILFPDFDSPILPHQIFQNFTPCISPTLPEPATTHQKTLSPMSFFLK